MPTFKQVTLVNPGIISDEYWIVHLEPNEQEWLIKAIDIYWDRNHRFLKAEDIQVSYLPVNVRTSLYLELDAWLKDRRQRARGIHALLADIGIRPQLRVVEGSAV